MPPISLPCNWADVQCDLDGAVEHHLPDVALFDQIPTGIFGNLTHLCTLSLRFNAPTSSFHSDLACLTQHGLQRSHFHFIQQLHHTQNLLSPSFLFSFTKQDFEIYVFLFLTYMVFLATTMLGE